MCFALAMKWKIFGQLRIWMSASNHVCVCVCVIVVGNRSKTCKECRKMGVFGGVRTSGSSFSSSAIVSSLRNVQFTNLHSLLAISLVANATPRMWTFRRACIRRRRSQAHRFASNSQIVRREQKREPQKKHTHTHSSNAAEYQRFECVGVLAISDGSSHATFYFHVSLSHGALDEHIYICSQYTFIYHSYAGPHIMYNISGVMFWQPDGPKVTFPFCEVISLSFFCITRWRSAAAVCLFWPERHNRYGAVWAVDREVLGSYRLLHTQFHRFEAA